MKGHNSVEILQKKKKKKKAGNNPKLGFINVDGQILSIPSQDNEWKPTIHGITERRIHGITE